MSLEKALGYLEKAGYREHVIQLGESTATVAMAAEALGVEPGRIAKTMSFLQGDKAVLIITELFGIHWDRLETLATRQY